MVILYIGLIKLEYSQETATTITFGSLVLGNLLLIIVSRSNKQNLFKILKKVNPSQKWVFGLAIGSFVLMTLIDFARERFQFSTLTIDGALIILLSGALGLLWSEAIKYAYK